MKKCYALNKPLLVDMYQNDLFCLEKALKSVLKYENNPSEQFDSISSFENSLKYLALALRLQFFIQNEDYHEILETLQKSTYILKTVYQICMDKAILTRLPENSEIQSVLHLIKGQIYDCKKVFSDVDTILCKELSSVNQ